MYLRSIQKEKYSVAIQIKIKRCAAPVSSGIVVSIPHDAVGHGAAYSRYEEQLKSGILLMETVITPSA